MKLEEIARAYLRCVEIDERAGSLTPALSEDIALLRADLHALLMQALREADIHFSDRADAARIAYELACGKPALP